MKRTTCPTCSDGQYPHYGLAPHRHVNLTNDPRSFIGSTRTEPKDQWPKNFTEDSDAEGCGVWHCPDCFDKDEES